MYNYLYIAVIILVFILIFSFLIHFAWIPILLFLMYWVYKTIKQKLHGNDEKTTYQNQYYDTYKQNEDTSYTQSSSQYKGGAIDADYTVVEEEETSNYRS